MDIQANNTIDQRYNRINKLGEGSYGKVYLYQRKQLGETTPLDQFFKKDKKSDCQFFAIKIYVKPDNVWEGVDFSSLREISFLQMLQHPNIVSCYEVLHRCVESRHQVMVVMDFHLELNKVLSQPLLVPTFAHRKYVAFQILTGLQYMHSNFVFHRDLKPDNVFVSRYGIVKIADFGFAKQFGTPYKKYTINACTREYRAPQIFFGTHYYTEKSDIWSFGCLIYYVFTQKHLFRADAGDIELLAKIFYLVGTPNENNWPTSSTLPRFLNFEHEDPKDLSSFLSIPPELAEIMEICLKLDPRRRPSAKELLKHSFFVDKACILPQMETYFQDTLNKLIQQTSNGQ